MSMPDLPIATERLLLRPFRKTDLDAVMAYHALPELQRYLDWKARDEAEVRAALVAMMREQRLHRPGDSIVLAVVRKAEDDLIGQVSLRWTDATAAQAELRFILAPEMRGEGFGREAVRAMLGLGFDGLNMHRIFARTSGRNEASAHLMRKLGMRLEAHYREHALFKGEWDDELHFAMLDREWKRGEGVKELQRHRVA